MEKQYFVNESEIPKEGFLDNISNAILGDSKSYSQLFGNSWDYVEDVVSPVTDYISDDENAIHHLGADVKKQYTHLKDEAAYNLDVVSKQDAMSLDFWREAASGVGKAMYSYGSTSGTAANKLVYSGMIAFADLAGNTLGLKESSDQVVDYLKGQRLELSLNDGKAQELLATSAGIEKIAGFGADLAKYANPAIRAEAWLAKSMYGVSLKNATLTQKTMVAIVGDTGIATLFGGLDELAKEDASFKRFYKTLFVDVLMGTTASISGHALYKGATSDVVSGMAEGIASSAQEGYKRVIKDSNFGKKLTEGAKYLKEKNPELYAKYNEAVEQVQKIKLRELGMSMGKMLIPSAKARGFIDFKAIGGSIGDVVSKKKDDFIFSTNEKGEKNKFYLNTNGDTVGGSKLDEMMKIDDGNDMMFTKPKDEPHEVVSVPTDRFNTDKIPAKDQSKVDRWKKLPYEYITPSLLNVEIGLVDGKIRLGGKSSRVRAMLDLKGEAKIFVPKSQVAQARKELGLEVDTKLVKEKELTRVQRFTTDDLANSFDVNPDDLAVYARQNGLTNKEAIMDAWRKGEIDVMRNYSIRQSFSKIRTIARQLQKEFGVKAKYFKELENYVQTKLESKDVKKREIALKQRATLQSFKAEIKKAGHEKAIDGWTDKALLSSKEFSLLRVKHAIISTKKDLTARFNRFKDLNKVAVSDRIGKIKDVYKSRILNIKDKTKKINETQEILKNEVKALIKDNSIKVSTLKLDGKLLKINNIKSTKQADKLLLEISDEIIDIKTIEDLKNALSKNVKGFIKDNVSKDVNSQLSNALLSIREAKTINQVDTVAEKISVGIEKILNSRTNQKIKTLMSKVKKAKNISSKSLKRIELIHSQYRDGLFDASDVLHELEIEMARGKFDDATRRRVADAEVEVAAAEILDDLDSGNNIIIRDVDELNASKIKPEEPSMAYTFGMNLLNNGNVIRTIIKKDVNKSKMWDYFKKDIDDAHNKQLIKKIDTIEAGDKIIQKNKLKIDDFVRIDKYSAYKQSPSKVENSMSKEDFRAFTDELDALGDDFLSGSQRELYDFVIAQNKAIKKDLFDAVEADTGVRPDDVDDYTTIRVNNVDTFRNKSGDLITPTEGNYEIMTTFMSPSSTPKASAKSTGLGAKVERVEHSLDIDFNIWDNFVRYQEQALYYTAMQKIIRRNGRILDDQRIKVALGESHLDVLKNYNETLSLRGHTTGNKPWMNSLIKNISTYFFGFNIGSALNQVVTSPMEMLLAMNAKDLLRGVALKNGYGKYSRSELEKFILSSSGDLKERYHTKSTVHQQVEDLDKSFMRGRSSDGLIKKKIKGGLEVKEEVGDTSMYLLHATDNTFAQMAWLSAYTKELKKKGKKFDISEVDNDAVLYANDIVSDSLGTHSFTKMSNYVARGDMFRAKGSSKTTSMGKSWSRLMNQMLTFMYSARIQSVYKNILKARYGKAASSLSAGMAKSVVGAGTAVFAGELAFTYASQAWDSTQAVVSQTGAEVVKDVNLYLDGEYEWEDVQRRVSNTLKRTIEDNAFKTIQENAIKAGESAVVTLPIIAQLYGGLKKAAEDEKTDDSKFLVLPSMLKEALTLPVAVGSMIYSSFMDDEYSSIKEKNKVREAVSDMVFTAGGVFGLPIKTVKEFYDEYNKNNELADEPKLEKEYVLSILKKKGTTAALQRVAAYGQPSGLINDKEVKSLFRSFLKEEYELEKTSMNKVDKYLNSKLYQDYLSMTEDHRFAFVKSLSDSSLKIFRNFERRVGKVKIPMDNNIQRYGRAIERSISNKDFASKLKDQRFLEKNKDEQRQWLIKVNNAVDKEGNSVVSLADYTIALDLIELQYDKANKEVDEEGRKDESMVK